MKIAIISPIQANDPLTNVWDWGLPVLQDGLSPHDRSRSYLASRALDDFPEAEAFLWIDDDTEATPDQAEALVKVMEEDGSDLVTGVYVCRHAAKQNKLALNFNLRYESGERRRSVNFGSAGGVYPITACGFGFVLTHRRLFERDDAPEANYFANDGGLYEGRAFFIPLVQGKQHLGEDRSFCARNQGARMMVNTRVCVGHAGHTLESVLKNQWSARGQEEGKGE